MNGADTVIPFLPDPVQLQCDLLMLLLLLIAEFLLKVEDADML